MDVAPGESDEADSFSGILINNDAINNNSNTAKIISPVRHKGGFPGGFPEDCSRTEPQILQNTADGFAGSPHCWHLNSSSIVYCPFLHFGLMPAIVPNRWYAILSCIIYFLLTDFMRTVS